MAGLGTGITYIPGNTGYQSAGNTTTTPLAISATFTGTAEDNSAPYVSISCFADVSGTLFFDFSVDGTNWVASPSSGLWLAAGSTLFETYYKGPRQFRARFVNDGSVQTAFRLYSYFDYNV